MRFVPVAPHVHTHWVVTHREGCSSSGPDDVCDCWPTAQCAECESMLDVGEWTWDRIRDGAVIHYVGERHG